MKRKLIYTALSLGIIMSACKGIAEDDRYIAVDAVKVERTVLLEDFTGQNCVNCPAAHRIVEGLEEQYGDHFIAVSIHAGHFGISATNKRYTGLMQEEGQIYNDRYHIEDYPQGVIDGHSPAINADLWATAVYEEISKRTPLLLKLDAELDHTGKNINIACTMKASENLSGNLVVWIVESGIVARQEDISQGRINDYVHNNVFRACVNGLDGDEVSLTAGEPAVRSYSIALKETETETWNASNLAAVAFVAGTDGVLQASRASVTTE